MVALSQTWKLATQPPLSAQITRQTPLHCEPSLATPIRMVLRARYFDPASGEFTSPDPLEYVDGMSLFRGYFVPGMVDPGGQTTINSLVEKALASGAIEGCLSLSFPILAIPGFSINGQICASVQMGNCCDATDDEQYYKTIKVALELYGEYGKTVSVFDDKPGKPKGANGPNTKVPHPCKPGQVVSIKDLERIRKRDCNVGPGQVGKGGNVGVTSFDGSCDDAGWNGVSGKWFVRGSAGVIAGIQANIEGNIFPNQDPTQGVDTGFTVGFTGQVGASIQIGVSFAGSLTTLSPTGEKCKSCSDR